MITHTALSWCWGHADLFIGLAIGFLGRDLFGRRRNRSYDKMHAEFEAQEERVNSALDESRRRL